MLPNGGTFIYWQSGLHNTEKLVIYASDTDEEFFYRLTNDPSVCTLSYDQKSDAYPEITWTEVLNTHTMTDQDALSMACECFGAGPMSASAYGSIIGIDHSDDGILIVLKILGVADDFQSVMVIKSNDELCADAYEYYAGTKGVYRIDENGIWICVTGDWQGTPIQTLYEGYVNEIFVP